MKGSWYYFGMGRRHVCGLFSKDKIETQLVHCAETEDADPDVYGTMFNVSCPDGVSIVLLK